MKNNQMRIIFFALAFVLCGCGQDKKPLEARLDSLEKRLKAVEEYLNSQYSKEQLKSTCVITPESNGYSIIQTDHGIFFVKATKTVPFLDGFTVTLGVGNLQSTDFSGCNAVVRWGTRCATNSITTSFVHGRWSRMDLNLTPCTVDELRGAQLTLTFDAVQMPELASP